jgi:hypothetical protein
MQHRVASTEDFITLLSCHSKQRSGRKGAKFLSIGKIPRRAVAQFMQNEIIGSK